MLHQPSNANQPLQSGSRRNIKRTVFKGYVIAAMLALSGNSVAQEELQIFTSVPSLGFPFFVHMQKEVSLFPDGASIVNLQGQPGASPAIDRNRGLHDVLDTMPDKYTFVAEQTANFAREEGASVTEAILAGLDTPPDVIVAANDDMALGALQVTQEQNLDIVIIGFDALPEALASVRDGGLTATIEQFPGGQSREAMQNMVSFLRDDAKPDPLVLLTPIAITSDNIEQGERLGEVN